MFLSIHYTHTLDISLEDMFRQNYVEESQPKVQGTYFVIDMSHFAVDV